jgi:hypothetical protein
MYAPFTRSRNARCVPLRLILSLLLAGFFLLPFSQIADAQSVYRYSAADRALLLRTAKQEQKAMDAYDRRGMIRIGQTYEGIWKKYKDTSMQAALRCYRYACLTEGDMSDYQLPVAYRLARIYDQGKLVPRNLEDAMAYYLLSDERGKKRLKQLTDSVCGLGTLRYKPNRDYQPGDSIVFEISPFCNRLHPETRVTLQELAGQLRGAPAWLAKVEPDFSYPEIAAPYNLMTVNFMWKNMELIRNFLVEQEGISHDRLLVEPAEPRPVADKGYRIIIRLQEQQ